MKFEFYIEINNIKVSGGEFSFDYNFNNMVKGTIEDTYSIDPEKIKEMISKGEMLHKILDDYDVIKVLDKTKIKAPKQLNLWSRK